MSRTFFSQQNDTKINDFDEGVLRRHNAHVFILSLVFLKLLIVSVAFFLGHPV